MYIKKINFCLFAGLLIFLGGCSSNLNDNNDNWEENGEATNQTKVLSPCEQAGGVLSTITECDGSESAWCSISEEEQCYAEDIRVGKCPDSFSPRVLCDGELGQ